MIRTENLRSAFTKDDVDEYLYKLLPERDAVVREMEDYAAEHGVPIIGPAVARLLSLLVQVSGAKRIFEMGSVHLCPVLKKTPGTCQWSSRRLHEKLIDWLDELTAECPKKIAHNMNDPCGAKCPKLPKVL